jgi:uncharacterized protein (TIGR02453 family)
MLDNATLDFLVQLRENNSKTWFDAHRQLYDKAKEDFIALVSKILDGILEFEPSFEGTKAKNCILRINRDIRFSADKSPYKIYFGAAFGAGGKSSGQLDYYLHIQPGGESFVGGGIWQPSSANLSKFRQEIDYNPEHLKAIINEPHFIKRYTKIYGEKLKTAPKGYATDHINLSLLQYKEMFFMCPYSDSELQKQNIATQIIDDFRLLKPFLDYSNEIFNN